MDQTRLFREERAELATLRYLQERSRRQMAQGRRAIEDSLQLLNRIKSAEAAQWLRSDLGFLAPAQFSFAPSSLTPASPAEVAPSRPPPS
jgi:hypothetical protein